MMTSFLQRCFRRGWLITVLLIMAAGAAAPARAQSPFALYNIGQRTTVDDARMVGRGGWGMAVGDSINPGFKNVASLTSLRHLVLKFTGYGERMDSKDTRGERMNSRVFVPDVRVAGPVWKERLALTAGFVVYRSTQYHTLIDTTWGQVWDDEVSGNDQFDRVGNRFRVPLGGAIEILPGVSVSGTVNIEGGSLKSTVNNFFTEPANPTNEEPYYQTNAKETNDEFHGTSQTWGIRLAPFSWFQLGGSWTPAHRIESDRTVTHFGVTQRAISSYTMEMPDEYLAGFQLRPFGRWRLGADGQYQDYGRFAGPEEWMRDMGEEYTLSAGLERVAARVRRGGFSNLPLRAGVSFKRWAYGVGGGPDDVKGHPIDEKTVSVGTGFPFGQSLGFLDLAVSYSIIGELEKNGLETTVWRLTLSVTGLEKWW